MQKQSFYKTKSTTSIYFKVNKSNPILIILASTLMFYELFQTSIRKL